MHNVTDNEAGEGREQEREHLDAAREQERREQERREQERKDQARLEREREPLAEREPIPVDEMPGEAGLPPITLDPPD